MSNKELQEKVAYFKDQELLDISDDEVEFLDTTSRNMERAFTSPPKPNRQPSSFLGPAPKEKRAEFEAHSSKRATTRLKGLTLRRSATAAEAKKSPLTKSRQRPEPSPENRSGKKPRKRTYMSDVKAQDAIPFYIRIGVAPRELKNGKNVKRADDIKLDLEARQLLKGKVVYFFPNDDVSMARRRRIHKIIQLGAAWVTSWRDDITHVIVDDNSHTYIQVLRNINKAGLPRKVTLVKFDPYVPQCIEFGTLLDPMANRFLVKGAPSIARNPIGSMSVPDSQTPLQVNSSRRLLGAKPSQQTDSVSTQDSVVPQITDKRTSSCEEIVKDSFIYSRPSPPEKSQEGLNQYNGVFLNAIYETKAIAHLPLDDDEDESPQTSSAEQDSDQGTDDENQEPSPKRAKISRSSFVTSKPSNGINQNTFQCMDPVGKSSSHNPNERTIEVLEQMCKYYDQTQDQWRTIAYRKAITSLRKQTTKIATAKEAAALPFIGHRLADKIEEIVLTDRLQKLDSTHDDPMDKVLRLFLGVYGAGLIQANKWIQAGYRTLDDLVTKAKLTGSQKIGIERFDDFAARIPRAEVEAHGNFVKDALQKLDSGFQTTIMGSYRRGAASSGDIDLIITKPGASIKTLREVAFQVLIPLLFKVGFLKVKLAASSRKEDGTKWHGASCLPSSNTWRRLDLLLVPEEEMGAALIYFTGNDIFNRSLRLLASKKGMRLNQKGLYKDVIRAKNREKLNEGTLVEGRDEKKIFEILGVPWREPFERIC